MKKKIDEKLNCGSDRLLDQDQVAVLLGVSSKTLEYWRWRQIGPPFVKVGRLVRYRMSDVMAYINALTSKTVRNGSK